MLEKKSRRKNFRRPLPPNAHRNCLNDLKELIILSSKNV
jgi:hypothetical protein